MKQLLAFAVLAFCGHVAMADDGGIVGIKVNDVKMSEDLGYDSKSDKEILKPVTNPNYQIEITGADAKKLLQLLPPSLFVYASPQFPKYQKVYNATQRALAINAKADQPAVTIYCSSGSIGYEPKNVDYKPYPDGTHCTISIGQNTETDTDTEYTFDPKKNLCSAH